MIVDSSAVIAILFGEPERNALLGVLADESEITMSAVAFCEVSVVAARRNANGATLIDDFIADLRIQIVPLDEDGARVARDAYRRYGTGNHPARLNLVDCCSYALAKSRNESLLFKSVDFAKTDVIPAWLP